MNSPESEEQMSVRELLPGDVNRIMEITGQSPGAGQWTHEMFSNLKAHAEKAWVAEWHGRVAGFLVVRTVTKDAEILNLAVDPPARRKGIAGALLQEALRELGGAGVHSVFLEVREFNAAGIAFYSNLGFTVYGRRPQYYRGPNDAALCMKKKLTGQDHVQD